jgi:hypothetical protein
MCAGARPTARKGEGGATAPAGKEGNFVGAEAACFRARRQRLHLSKSPRGRERRADPRASPLPPGAHTPPRAGYSALWFVNGFKSYNADGNPNVRLASDQPPRPVMLPRRGRGARWELPPAGQDPGRAAPGLLGGVKQAVMFQQARLTGV